MSQRYIVTISGLDSWTHANCLKINDEQGSNSNARTLTVALQVHKQAEVHLQILQMSKHHHKSLSAVQSCSQPIWT